MKNSLNNLNGWKSKLVAVVAVSVLGPRVVLAHGGGGGHMSHSGSSSHSSSPSRSNVRRATSPQANTIKQQNTNSTTLKKLGFTTPNQTNSKTTKLGSTGVSKTGVSTTGTGNLNPNPVSKLPGGTAGTGTNSPVGVGGSSGTGTSSPIGIGGTTPVGIGGSTPSAPVGGGSGGMPTNPGGAMGGGTTTTPTMPGSGGGGRGFGGFGGAFPLGAFGGYGFGGGYAGGGYAGNGYVDSGAYSPAAVADVTPPVSIPANVAQVPTPTSEVAPTLAAAPASTGNVDLVVEDIQMVQSPTLIAGPAYRVEFRNQGMQAAGPFRVGVFAALDGKVADNATAVVEVPGLAAGEARQVTLRLPVAAMKIVSVSTSQPSVFTQLLVAVDPDNAVSESNKTNNVATVDRTAFEAR